MDSQTSLQDHGGSPGARKGRDRQQGNDEVDTTSESFRISRSPRKIPTGAEGSRYQHEDLIDHPGASSASISSVNPSWDEHSDDDAEMDPSRRDRRKYIDVTTPTLIDESDFIEEGEEEEMVSLEQERLRMSSRAFFGQDESYLRRTPGAQMYKSNFGQESVRRTPGSTQLRATDSALKPDSSKPEAAALGFGLTLSTPVASTGRDRSLGLTSSWETPSKSTTRGPQEAEPDEQLRRPPLPPENPNRDQPGAFVAPWNLSKSTPAMESSHGAYSPHTLRLTEDLGNLLLEDENDADAEHDVGQRVFTREDKGNKSLDETTGSSKQEGSESWTAPYVISMDVPTRVPRSSTTRSRRNKADNSRRSRGFDRTGAATRHFEGQGMNTGGFLQYAQQPKPVRHVQPQPFTGFKAAQVGSGGGSRPPSGAYGAVNEPDTGAVPSVLNFGGAFAPPSKNYGGHFQRPSTSPGPPQPPVPVNQPNFSANTGTFGAVPHQGTFPQAHMGAHPAKFQPFPPQNPMFEGGHPPVGQTPNFSFPPPNVGYHMHSGGMPPPPQEFVQDVPVHPQHRPPVPQFGPPQVWTQTMPMQYANMGSVGQGGWHGAQGGWPMGEYGFGMPHRASDSPPVAVAPAQTWGEPEINSFEMPTNPFASLRPPSGTQTPTSVSGNKTRGGGKNQRKGASKKASKSQTKADKTQKSDPQNLLATGKKSPVVKKNKKKQTKDRGYLSARPSSSTPTEEVAEGNPEDPADLKRAELAETPATRSAFKEFYRKFRAEEKSSIKDAEAYALQAVSDGSLPESVHWKVYLELADLAKRANHFQEARKLYQQVCHLQPYANQGWLEFSKLEEECGNMVICAKILRKGLEYCEYSENLLSRAIKHEEKMRNIGRARELLSRLKHVGIEKVWRTVLEGALLEARAGNDVMARRVLKYLMHHVPWYGPLYLEAYRLERDLGRSGEALEIVERGLASIPRYGPLWFGAFRLCEEMDLLKKDYRLPQSMAMIDRATGSISKELIWKVHLEAAQMLERTSFEFLDTTTNPTSEHTMDLCRKRFAMTILSCPPNLRWKVWLASGRMEVAAGNADRARRLFLRAHKVVPDKGRAVALLECARLEEFVGDVKLAEAILCKSRSVGGSDWKVWLESVALEIRCGRHSRAMELAYGALKLHSGTGRLWALLVQLRRYDKGEEAQFKSLKQALNAVPKSGEVWCEGARIHLNPLARTFDIPSARRHLSFATKFTPQFGDGFLETLRLELVDQWLVPIAKLVWESTKGEFGLVEETDKKAAMGKYVLEVSIAVHSVCTAKAGEEITQSFIDKGAAKLVRDSLKPAFRESVVDVSSLQLQCGNADPNYGSLWFHCRTGPTDTARTILAQAVRLMFAELRSHAHVYVAALMRRFAILACLDRDIESGVVSGPSGEKGNTEDAAKWDNIVKEAFLSAPSLAEMTGPGTRAGEATTGMDLLESTMTESGFATGLAALSRQVPMEELSLSERRKALFGSDALFS